MVIWGVKSLGVGWWKGFVFGLVILFFVLCSRYFFTKWRVGTEEFYGILYFEG